jgi:RNA polymerase subunit RPABC4/transcription elongation factor Spt4
MAAQNREPEYRDCCPACGSFDIDTVDAGLIGGESFVTLRCRACGREDTLDNWQQSLWRKKNN